MGSNAEAIVPCISSLLVYLQSIVDQSMNRGPVIFNLGPGHFLGG